MRDTLEDILVVARFIGVHPGLQDVFAHFRTSVVFVPLAYSCVSILYLTCTVGDFASISSAIEAAPMIYQVISKLIAFKFGTRHMKQIHDNLSEFIQPEALTSDLKRKVFKQRKFQRRCYIAYCSLIFYTLLFYLLKPMFGPTRGLCMNWYVPCDISSNSCYATMNLLQMFHHVVFFMMICVADGSFIILSFRIVEQFAILKHQLRVLSQEVRPPEDYLDKLYFIVDQHNVVLKFIERLNNTCYRILFDQFWSTFTAVCTGLLLFILEGFPPTLMTSFKYATFMSVLLVQLFVFCQMGELIGRECEGFGYEAYSLNWHQSPNKEIKYVTRMMIHTSNHALGVCIGKLLPLNLETFARVIKHAVSFYALLHSVYTGLFK